MIQDGSTGISVQHVSQNYGKKEVLNDVSFEAAPGSIVGIIGINGGGKSTLLSILAGINSPESGQFLCFGTDMFHNKEAFRRLIGYLPQDNPLLEELSVADNLRLWYGSKIREDLPVLDEMQLRDLLPLKVKSLSGGMKRRLSIACAVALSQPVLILDEPSSSLDLHQKKIISDYIRSYTRKCGIVLLSTHDMEEIRLCTDIFYLEKGNGMFIGAEEAIERLRTGMG